MKRHQTRDYFYFVTQVTIGLVYDPQIVYRLPRGPHWEDESGGTACSQYPEKYVYLGRCTACKCGFTLNWKNVRIPIQGYKNNENYADAVFPISIKVSD